MEKHYASHKNLLPPPPLTIGIMYSQINRACPLLLMLVLEDNPSPQVSIYPSLVNILGEGDKLLPRKLVRPN